MNDYWKEKRLTQILRSWGYFVLQKRHVVVAIDDNHVYILDFNDNKKILSEPKKLHIYRVRYMDGDKYRSFIAKLLFERGGRVEEFPFGKDIQITSTVPI